MQSEDDCKACRELNAITLGIEIRFDSLLGYSRLVTQKTIEAARNIGIPEPAIRHWEVERRKQIRTTNLKTLKSRVLRH